MENESITDEQLPEGSDVVPAGGESADQEGSSTEQPSDVAALSLEAINKDTGKDFKTIEEARKAIGDTWKDNTQTKQELAALRKGKEESVPTGDFVPRSEFEEQTFFSQKPEYAQHRELITSLRKDGESLETVVNTDAFKNIYEPAKAHAETEKTKSVLQSSPRLGQVTDKVGKAKDLIAQSKKALVEGDTLGSEAAYTQAKGNAIGSVIDAYELDA